MNPANNESHAPKRSDLNRRKFLYALAALGMSSTVAPGDLRIQERTKDESGISAETLKAAEKIAGIELSDKEREEILEGVRENKGIFRAFREQRMDYFQFPSLTFNPVPPGVHFDAQKKKPVFSDVSIKKPDSIEDMAFFSVLQLAALLRTRQTTSMGLTEMYLSRLKRYDKQLQFVVNLTEDLALRQAKKADMEIGAGNYKGLLHGIPYGIKDLYAVKGYPTTWGTGVFKDRVIDLDATVVKRLEAAGAVLVAKLSTGTLASGSKWFGGQTKNPWTRTSSGGSSAGPASAVAAGCVAFSIGTETNGSMVSPCDACGTTGLRPTFGRISRYGCMPVSWSFDKVTPIGRTVEDCAVFNEIHGPDLFDNSVVDRPFNWDAGYDINKLKLGYHSTYFEKAARGIPLDEESKDWFESRSPAIRRVLAWFAGQGFDLIPLDIELPHIGEGIMMEVEAAAAFDEFTRGHTDDLVEDQKWPTYHRIHRFVPAVEYLQAARYRALIIQKMHDILKDVDVYMEMTWSTNWSTNVTGLPIVVVPCGFLDNGEPTSVTFVGKLHQEDKLLAVAKAYQDATGHHLKHPELYK
jgi:Asp-tRNA(Asn)/Glu-tRNA(Gln) amidotransferase A subunit family amidase